MRFRLSRPAGWMLLWSATLAPSAGAAVAPEPAATDCSCAGQSPSARALGSSSPSSSEDSASPPLLGTAAEP